MLDRPHRPQPSRRVPICLVWLLLAPIAVKLC
jgi:hypothetical protein